MIDDEYTTDTHLGGWRPNTQTGRCPCFLHSPNAARRDWKHLSCACECDVPHEEYGGLVPRCPSGRYPACVSENSLCTFPKCVGGAA